MLLVATHLVAVVLWASMIAAIVLVARMSRVRRTRSERARVLRAAAARHWQLACAVLLSQGALTIVLLDDRVELSLVVAGLSVVEAVVVARFAGVSPRTVFGRTKRACSERLERS